MKGKCYRCGSGEHMANNCPVAKVIKCRSCSASQLIAAACLPTASVRAEGESGQGQSTLAVEYQPDRQQQPKQAAQVNYVQSFPSLQSGYPSREAGRYYFLPQQGNQCRFHYSSGGKEGKTWKERKKTCRVRP